jgi:hypothetical protein
VCVFARATGYAIQLSLFSAWGLEDMDPLCSSFFVACTRLVCTIVAIVVEVKGGVSS